MAEIMALEPQERHRRMSALHEKLYQDYTAAIRALTPEEAMRPVNLGAETRNLAQVVGHITEWERFIIMACGDVLAGVEHPRMVTDLGGYVEPDGQRVQFDSIDAFNAYQAEKHSGWSWEQIQALAMDTAAVLHALFTQPNLLTAERLERTRPITRRLPRDVKLSITMGWSLWMTTLDHIAVEHAQELGLP